MIALLLWAPSQGQTIQEPVLAIHLISGETFYYPVGSVERVDFSGDSLLVVSGSSSEGYPLADIEGVRFLWDASAAPDPGRIPTSLETVRLFANRPNPFSSRTRITYEMDRPGRVELQIYSVSGRLIRTLVDEEQSAGSYGVAWDGRDERGRRLPAGVYFYRLAVGGAEAARRMILLP
jgi:hypothetical protein